MYEFSYLSNSTLGIKPLSLAILSTKPCIHFQHFKFSFNNPYYILFLPLLEERMGIPEHKDVFCRCAIPAAAPPLRGKDNPGSEMELAWISSIFIPFCSLLPLPADIGRRPLDGAKGSGIAKVGCFGVRFKDSSCTYLEKFEKSYFWDNRKESKGFIHILGRYE